MLDVGVKVGAELPTDHYLVFQNNILKRHRGLHR